MTTTRYRKRPVEVDTIQWTGSNEAELVAFTGNRFEALDPEDRADDPEITAQVLDVLHSTWVGVKNGQHIVRGVKGEYYPIAEDVLAETYERVDDRATASTVSRFLFEETARRHKGTIARVDELLAVIERVRTLATAIRDATAAGHNDWQIGQHDCAMTVLAALHPTPAATEATELKKTVRVLSALHQSADDTVTRVITLHEQWVAAGPPPLGAPLARWWDGRLAELHNAIQPADQTTEK
ncbi:hypothetical protein ACFVFT_14820 [Streptomyces tendae]|uniref:hypothetical protein n=1 Tax=Streptomyces tendae TaxID=1932 RepID=UPI0036ADDF38